MNRARRDVISLDTGFVLIMCKGRGARGQQLQQRPASVCLRDASCSQQASSQSEFAHCGCVLSFSSNNGAWAARMWRAREVRSRLEVECNMEPGGKRTRERVLG